MSRDITFPGKTILIVDDDRFSRTLMREICVQLGFSRILVADSGESALHVCKNYTIDVILSDLAMPGITGLELLERVRNGTSGVADRDLPVVFLTGAATEAMLKRALVVGVDRCIAKPPSIDRVRRSLASALLGR